MKRALFWIWIISIVAFAVDWVIVGLSLLSGNYDITAGAYIGLGCLVVMAPTGIAYKLLNNACPHCGKIMPFRSRYCSYCGKELQHDDKRI